MKFFSPQVQISRVIGVEKPTIYTAHVVTFCDKTNYVADGFSTDTSELAQNLFILTVKVKQEASLPDIDYITPVVHTIPLGEIAFPQGEGFIRVQVKIMELANRDGNPTNGGVKTTSSTDADNQSK